MSHSPLTFKNLFATGLAVMAFNALPAAAQTPTQSDSGLAPLPTCVPANTTSGYAMPDTSGYVTVALPQQKPAEICVTPESPPLSAADQAYLVKFSHGLTEAFSAHPDLPLSKRFKGNFKGPNQRPDIEITSSGVMSHPFEGQESMTYLFTLQTTDRNHLLVTGQIRLSRPDGRDPEETPETRVVPYSAPQERERAPRLAT